MKRDDIDSELMLHGPTPAGPFQLPGPFPAHFRPITASIHSEAGSMAAPPRPLVGVGVLLFRGAEFIVGQRWAPAGNCGTPAHACSGVKWANFKTLCPQAGEAWTGPVCAAWRPPRFVPLGCPASPPPPPPRPGKSALLGPIPSIPSVTPFPANPSLCRVWRVL